MKILVVTSHPDPHVDMVKRHLAKDEFIIFDPLKFPNKFKITYLWENGQLQVKLGNDVISDSDVVWFRKPKYLKPESLPVEKRFRQFTWKNYRETVTWLYDLLPYSFWVSKPEAIYRGNNKLYQMEVAVKLGFDIPETLVTNQSSEVKRFRQKYGDIVTKPMYPEAIRQNGDVYFMYTTLLEATEKVDLSGLAISPAIFQRVIHGEDIRVTVIGKRVFATKIVKKGTTKASIDWRVGITDGRKLGYVETQLPKGLEISCKRLVQKMGLQYGAIDFIKDDAGVYWFLEINPNGQWGFVEQMTAQKLSLAMASLFEDRC